MAAPFFQGRKTAREEQLAGLAILTAFLLLPSLLAEKIGWLACLIPLPVFYYYVSLGRQRGAIALRNAVLLASGCAVLFGILPMLIFSLTLVPLGIVLSCGIFKEKSPVAAGFNGFLVLTLTWLLYWTGLALLYGTNPYGSLLAQLDRGLSSGFLLYEKSAGLKPEILESVRQAVEILRVYIPKILPALLVSALLGTTWLNLVLGTLLLQTKDRRLTPWPDYSEWKLPEPLVWLVILSGVCLLLLPRPLSLLGLNGLIVCSTLYFFQGLAIAAKLLKRWSVPKLIRVLIYALIFIQTYGIIVLSFLGLVDVWADFRKLNQTGDNPTASV